MLINIMLIILVSLMVFNSNIHLPCLPFIRDEFTSSSFIVQFAFILNPLISIFANFIFGFLSEVYNKKYLLIITLVCFLSGTIICFYAPTIIIFLLGRLLQAIGDGGTALLSIAILSILSKEQFAYYLGISSATFAIGWGVGPIIGTFIFKLVGWRWNFFLIFLFVFVVTIILILYLPSHPLKSKDNTHPGILSLGHRIYALINSPIFSVFNWSSAIAIGTFGAFEVNSPFIFIDSYNFTPAKFALFNALIIAINGFASFIYLKVIKYFNIKGAFIAGTIIYIFFVISCILFLSRVVPTSPYLILLSISFLAFCLPFIMSTTTIYALKVVEDKEGLVLATLSGSRNIASSCISLIVSSFYTGNIYPFFTISLIFSIIALRFLVKGVFKVESIPT